MGNFTGPMSNSTEKVRNKKVKRKKNKISMGCIVFLVLLGTVLYGAFNLYSTLRASLIKTYILDMGEISNTIPKDILIIREEAVLRSPATGYISYYADNGDRLRKGGVVGKIQNEELRGDESINLRIIDRRINEIRSGVDVKNPELEIEQIDLRIDFLFSDIQNRIQEKDYSYIPALKNELSTLIERKKLIQGASSLGDFTLDQLLAQKTDLENRINSEKFYIRAKDAGILSFYYDGAGEKFNIEKIKQLKVSDIEKFEDQNKISKKDKVNSGDVVATVIGNHRWYFITEVTKEDIQRIERGKVLRCMIEGETVHAVLDDFYKDEEGRFVGIFQVASENYDFTGKRRSQAKIEYKRSLGLMIQKDSVTQYEGTQGIFVVDEVGVARFRKIEEFLGENEEYYNIGYDLNAPKQDALINLYDEIVSDPEGIKEGQRIR